MIISLGTILSSLQSDRLTRTLGTGRVTAISEMIMERIPAQDTGTPSSGYMVGQADPSRESGRPRLIKAV